MKLAVPTKESSLRESGTARPLSLPTLSLRTNFLWTIIGNLTYSLAQWGIIVALTKISEPELVGRYALALAITGPLVTLTSLQLRSIQATDATGEFHFGDYLALRMVMMLVVLSVIGAVALAGGYRWEVGIVIFALGIARCIEGISEIFLGLFQQHERMDLVSQSTILKGILSLPGFLGGYFVTQNLFGGVAGLGAAWLLVLTLFDLPQGRALASPKIFRQCLRTPRKLIRLAWVALPLGIGTALAALEISVPRYFIEHQFGERELGIFAALAYLTAIPAQAINALGQAASPKLAKLRANGERTHFLKLLTKLVCLGLLIGVVGFLVTVAGGRTILQLFYTTDYTQQSEILTWLMAAAGITYCYIFLGTALNALRAFQPRIPIHLLTLSVLLPACHVLGSRWGVVGVAWAIGLSQLVSALSYLVAVTAYLPKPSDTLTPSIKSLC